MVAISNRWSLRMPRAGISVQHTACTRRAARRRVLARSFCAHFPLRASLAPSAPALASHGVLLTLQVESCTSPWLCTLLRLFLLSLSISAVRHPHKCRPSQIIVMQHHTARPRATEAGRRAAARMANPSKNRKCVGRDLATFSATRQVNDGACRHAAELCLQVGDGETKFSATPTES